MSLTCFVLPWFCFVTSFAILLCKCLAHYQLTLLIVAAPSGSSPPADPTPIPDVPDESSLWENLELVEPKKSITRPAAKMEIVFDEGPIAPIYCSRKSLSPGNGVWQLVSIASVGVFTCCNWVVSSTRLSLFSLFSLRTKLSFVLTFLPMNGSVRY